MAIRQFVKRLLGRPTPPPPIVADRFLHISELLAGDLGDNVCIPLLPKETAPNATGDIDYAAATVLERLLLGALAQRHQAKRIFEIGTFRGVTALVMANNAPEGAVLYTLDLPPEFTPAEIADRFYADDESGFHKMSAEGVERNVGVLLRNYAGTTEIHQLYGDTAEFDFAPYRDSIDLFFVDGCHDYDAARRDTLSAWSCLRPGGLIVWHDYNWPSVQDAVRDVDLHIPIHFVRETSIAFGTKPL